MTLPNRLKLQIDGVITDIRLGRGPDGWAVASRARQRVVDLPVIYLSADDVGDWSHKGLPGSVMLTKPIPMAPLTAAIANLLNARTPRPYK